MERNTIIEEGMCECIGEPMGDNGLEGYISGEQYRYQHMSRDKNGNPYYRLYPGEYNYYETCGAGTFSKFFKKIQP